MIDIVYDRDNLSVSIKGHAQSGEAGHDLVCASASILAYTLATNVSELSCHKKHVRRPKIEIKEGNTNISCSPVHGMTALTTMIFDSVCVGFEILEQKYPEHVKYTVKG